MMSQEQALATGGHQSSVASLIFDKPVTTRKGNQISIDEYHLQLQPLEKRSITLSLRTTRPERVEEFFEIMVKDGQSQFF